MARLPRHKHHGRKSRSNWAVMGAFMASAAFVPRLAATVDAAELKRSLEHLRIAVPSETLSERVFGAQAQGDSDRPQRFEIASGPLRQVVAELERLSGARLIIANDAINEISSPGLSGTYTLSQALARLLAGTSVTSRVTGPNTITLEIRLASESVDVTASVPQPAPSSPKYGKPLVEIPQTIEVIPREVMEEQGVTTLSDALRNVPGISLQAGEGGGASNTSGDMFNLRGFSANNSLFVDGVRDDGLMSRDVFNLEQVEVFMGPTGSDVGRGNAAGYVNMQTKTPHAQSAYAVTYRLRQRRSESIGGRSQSRAAAWRCRQLAGPHRSSSQRAVAGRRRAWAPEWSSRKISRLPRRLLWPRTPQRASLRLRKSLGRTIFPTMAFPVLPGPRPSLLRRR